MEVERFRELEKLLAPSGFELAPDVLGFVAAWTELYADKVKK